MNRSLEKFYTDSSKFCKHFNCTYNDGCPAQHLRYCPGISIKEVEKEDVQEFLEVLDAWIEKEGSV